MQEMMGTLVQKVTEMEKKYDELSKAKDSSDIVCENAEKEIYLPWAGVRKTTSQAFRPRAEERKGSALSLRNKAVTQAAAKKKTQQVKVTFVSRFKVPRRMCLLC